MTVETLFSTKGAKIIQMIPIKTTEYTKNGVPTGEKREFYVVTDDRVYLCTTDIQADKKRSAERPTFEADSGW